MLLRAMVTARQLRPCQVLEGPAGVEQPNVPTRGIGVVADGGGGRDVIEDLDPDVCRVGRRDPQPPLVLLPSHLRTTGTQPSAREAHSG